MSQNVHQQLKKQSGFQAYEARNTNFDEMERLAEKKLQTPEDAVIEELNQKHAVVHTDQFIFSLKKITACLKARILHWKAKPLLSTCMKISRSFVQMDAHEVRHVYGLHILLEDS